MTVNIWNQFRKILLPMINSVFKHRFFLNLSFSPEFYFMMWWLRLLFFLFHFWKVISIFAWSHISKYRKFFPGEVDYFRLSVESHGMKGVETSSSTGNNFALAKADLTIFLVLGSLTNLSQPGSCEYVVVGLNGERQAWSLIPPFTPLVFVYCINMTVWSHVQWLIFSAIVWS